LKENNENKRKINDITVSCIKSTILNVTTDLVPNDDSNEEYSYKISRLELAKKWQKLVSDDLEIKEKDIALFPSLFPISDFEKLENMYQNSALVIFFSYFCYSDLIKLMN